MNRILWLAVIVGLLFCLTGCKSSKYQDAQEQLTAGNYDAAITAFTELGHYKDSAALLSDALCGKAEVAYSDGNLLEALSLFQQAVDSTDAQKRANEIQTEIEAAQAVYDARQKIVQIREDFFNLTAYTFYDQMAPLLDVADSFLGIDNANSYQELNHYIIELLPNLAAIKGIYEIDDDMMSQYKESLTTGEFFMFPTTVQLSLSQSESIYKDLMDRVIGVEFPEKYMEVISTQE